MAVLNIQLRLFRRSGNEGRASVQTHVLYAKQWKQGHPSYSENKLSKNASRKKTLRLLLDYAI